MTRELYCRHGTFTDKCFACKGEAIQRLRGQLQNCVNHLDRANRRDEYDEVIASANKALYETLHS